MEPRANVAARHSTVRETRTSVTAIEQRTDEVRSCFKIALLSVSVTGPPEMEASAILVSDPHNQRSRLAS